MLKIEKTGFKPACDYLPQRPPMMVVDDVLESDLSTYVVTQKHIHADDFFLNGHFPGRPVVPGSVILEMMMQSCGVLLSLREMKSDEDYQAGIGHVAKIKSALFIREVLPGQTIRFRCTSKVTLMNFIEFAVIASVEGKNISTADFVLAV